jgi:DNA helicase-2/ATP-dependent DNA helicase PcrA
MSDYLSSLNPQQKEAVLHREGPLLILAGAGSGKTRVITYRILHLIREGVAPDNILAITFTNKAAKEMRDRVLSLLSSDRNLNLPSSFNEKPFVSTFHSLGVYLIRENHALLGLPKHFAIFDRSDSLSAVKEALSNSGLDPKQHEPGKILGAISRVKGDMRTISPEKGYFERIIHSVYGEYEKILAKEKALDFDDLLVKTLKLLQIPEVLKKYQDRWKYVHIDEYQDTNTVQYLISRKLSESHKNICVVGDADQNIYSWRGADIRNILSFEEDYPSAKVVNLEENYRSTANILEAANKVIEKNSARHPKNLFTKSAGGEKILLYEAVSEKDEAMFVADKSRELIAKGVKPEDISVFYRANFQSRALEETFLRLNVPYQVLGTRFFERKEVKDVLSYISAALNPENFTSIKRIINTPPRGIGKVALIKILGGDTATLTPSARASFNKFTEILNSIKEKSENSKVSELVKFTAKISGIEDSLMKGNEEDTERVFNVRELANLASKYDDIPAPDGVLKFLEEAILASDQDELRENKSGVKLMTVHASKGLEFDYCFIVGLEENLFPMSMGGELDTDKLEEERRLFYVAITRARKKVIMTHAFMRTIFGSENMSSPSRFLADIPSELIEVENVYGNSLLTREGGRGLLDDIDF